MKFHPLIEVLEVSGTASSVITESSLTLETQIKGGTVGLKPTKVGHEGAVNMSLRT